MAVAPVAFADKHSAMESSAEICQGFGPQTPRDIDSKVGTNDRIITMAPDSSEMNLCNIHYHVNAEHKAEAFSIYAGEGENGYGGGYKCNISENLTAAELAPIENNACKNLNPGDTIEVHWVHSSCDVTPGAGLGSCLSETCANPNLRVETQVFTVVNDPNALDFNDMSYGGNMVDGYHQPKMIPSNTGEPVEFAGSTTGPSFTEQSCSPLQVSWSVRPQCAKVDISSLSAWCEDNVFEENKGHGVRKLVTNPALLSEIE